MTVRNAVKAGGAVIDVVANNSPLVKSLKGLPGLINALSIGTAIGAALLAGIGQALNTGNTFQQEVRKATAVFGDLSQDQLETFRKTAIEVSKVTLFTANELGAALFGIGSAGFSAEQARAALLPVTQFAQASGSTIEAAAEQLSDSLEGFGLKSTDGDTLLNNTQRLSDLLVKANTTSTTTSAQLAQGLGKAAGPLANANVGIEETIAALTVFADSGLKGSEAGNGLANVVIDLQNKAVKNAEAFRALGLEVFDIEGRFVGVAAAAASFSKATEGLSDQQKTARLATLGLNEETRKNILRLKDGSKILERQAEILDASGLTAQTATNQMTEYAAATERAAGAYTQLGDAFADSALGDAQVTTIKGLAIAMEGLAQAIEELFPSLAKLNGPQGFLSEAGFTGASRTLSVLNSFRLDAFAAANRAATFDPLASAEARAQFAADARFYSNQAAQIRGQVGRDIAAATGPGGETPAEKFIKDENERLQKQIDSIKNSSELLSRTSFAGSGFGAQEFINGVSTQANIQDRMLMALEAIAENTKKDEDEEGQKTIKAVVK